MSNDFDPSRMPVLIGCGQITDKREPEEAGTPIDLMAESARRAAADAGPGQALLEACDALVAVGLVVDDASTRSGMAGHYRNVPHCVSRTLAIAPARQSYTDTGGNTPQKLVNRFADHIARGEHEVVLLTGAEALHTMIGRLKRGLPMDDWYDDSGGDPDVLGDARLPATEHELAYGIKEPANVYPLFENALRGKYGSSVDAHQRHLGELFARFNAVAAENPLSWFPTPRSAEDIASASEDNRYVGFPYTKYLNSVIQVNMGASVIMTSVSKARSLGVPEDRFVFLHGCADGHDPWYLHERENLCSSPAIRTLGEKALGMAGKSIGDMDYFDLYSCFPSAVQIACDELGIAHDDPRGLTVTGGLPYFGGAGNNYVMHAISHMVAKLRAKPGSFGLLNGNGWFITKHSLGVYSTAPPTHDWQREDPASYQQDILAVAAPVFTECPEGPATIETYTVLNGRKGLEGAIVVGRLEDGTRFMADAPPEQWEAMMQRDMLGARGAVRQVEGRNLFISEM